MIQVNGMHILVVAADITTIVSSFLLLRRQQQKSPSIPTDMTITIPITIPTAKTENVKVQEYSKLILVFYCMHL